MRSIYLDKSKPKACTNREQALEKAKEIDMRLKTARTQVFSLRKILSMKSIVHIVTETFSRHCIMWFYELLGIFGVSRFLSFVRARICLFVDFHLSQKRSKSKSSVGWSPVKIPPNKWALETRAKVFVKIFSFKFILRVDFFIKFLSHTSLTERKVSLPGVLLRGNSYLWRTCSEFFESRNKTDG